MGLLPSGFRLTRKRLLLLAAAVVACVALGWAYEHIDGREVHERTRDLNAAVVFGLMLILPLVGFPVTVVNAVAGMRFGLWLGLALGAVAIVFHVLVSFAVVRLAPHVFAERLHRLRRRLPQGADTPVTVFTALVPGVPYFAKNYLLPLVGVPLRTFLLWAAPIHFLHAVFGIVLGEIGEDLTPKRVALLAAYYLVITAGCGWALRRVRAQVKDRPPAAGDRKSRASGHSVARTRAGR